VFRSIARDPENRIMILTGTGDLFTGPRASEANKEDPFFHARPAREWEEFHMNGPELMDSLCSIQALVIGAVNGPAYRHMELVLMSDIVLASETAKFQDSAHFPNGLAPGDGINVYTRSVLGATRARYFHLTGQVLDAKTALDWGLVNEVLKPADLMDRAWVLARQLVKQDPMTIRHTRLLFTHELRKRMLEMVSYGLAMEGLEEAAKYDSAIAKGHRPKTR
jgi:enoyl-CoA hydratase/carnithine racemase